MDDGSTDRTADIVPAPRREDPRVRLLGAAAAGGLDPARSTPASNSPRRARHALCCSSTPTCASLPTPRRARRAMPASGAGPGERVPRQVTPQPRRAAAPSRDNFLLLGLSAVAWMRLDDASGLGAGVRPARPRRPRSLSRRGRPRRDPRAAARRPKLARHVRGAGPRTDSSPATALPPAACTDGYVQAWPGFLRTPTRAWRTWCPADVDVLLAGGHLLPWCFGRRPDRWVGQSRSLWRCPWACVSP